MSCVAQFSIFPIGEGVSVAGHVAKAVGLVKASGLPYVLGPMGTALEGEYDQVMAVIARCHQVLRRDCERVYLSVTVDWRDAPSGRLEGKVASVEERLP